MKEREKQRKREGGKSERDVQTRREMKKEKEQKEREANSFLAAKKRLVISFMELFAPKLPF